MRKYIPKTDIISKAKRGLAGLLVGAAAIGVASCDNPVEVNQAPVASVYAEPMQGNIPLEVSFDASRSYDPDGTIGAYHWDVDNDGVVDTTTTSPYFVHTYTTEGTHTTSLSVEDDEGAMDRTSVQGIEANLPNQAPVASLSASPMTAYTGQEVTLDMSESTDSDGNIIEYRFDFDGDGVFDDTTTTPSTTHAYSVAGTYNLRGEVVDDDGATASTSLEGLVVEEAELIAYGMKINNNDEIYISNKDGTGRVRLTFSSYQDINPSWSPDGEHLVFQSNRDSRFALYLVNVNNGNLTKLTPDANISFFSPSWSPNGSEIWFGYVDKDENTQGLGRINADSNTNDIEKISEKTDDNTLPQNRIAFSPDGKRVFYDEYRNGNRDIFEMDIESREETNLTQTPDYSEIFPSISPEGKILHYVTNEFGGEFSGLEIMSKDLETGAVERITNTLEMEVDPMLSPNGKQLMFSRWEGDYSPNGQWVIYIADENGENEVPVDLPGSARFAKWRQQPNAENQ